MAGRQLSWMGSEPTAGKERAMDKKTMSDGVIRYFQGSPRDFTPITVSADFAALVRPKCLGGEEGSNGKESVKKPGLAWRPTP